MTKMIIEKYDSLRHVAISENFVAVTDKAIADNWPPAKIVAFLECF